MHLTLIKPNIGRMEHSLYVDEGRMEPLQLGVLAALTPPDVDVALWDDRLETIPYDEPTDLVAITVETYTARRAYEIAAEYRRAGRARGHGRHAHHPDAGGGPPPRRRHLHRRRGDGLGRGDRRCAPGCAEIALRRAGGIAPTRRADPAGCLRRARAICPSRLMQFSRGCRFACNFCAVSRYFDRGHFVRCVDEVVAEIEARDRNRIIFFVDDNILSNFDAAKELCRALIPLNVRWVSQGSIDMTQDRELMELMVRERLSGHGDRLRVDQQGEPALDAQVVQLHRRLRRLWAGGADPAGLWLAGVGGLHPGPRPRHGGLHPRDQGVGHAEQVRPGRFQHPGALSQHAPLC